MHQLTILNKMTSKFPPPPQRSVPTDETIGYSNRPDPYLYTVGTTESGQTVLKIHSTNGLASTLKLRPDSVRQLIRMLEATLQQ